MYFKRSLACNKKKNRNKTLERSSVSMALCAYVYIRTPDLGLYFSDKLSIVVLSNEGQRNTYESLKEHCTVKTLNYMHMFVLFFHSL